MTLPIADHWYEIEALAHGVSWIDEPQVRYPGINVWLIEGRDRSLIFDTGTGLGDLAGFVAQRVRGPVLAVASTGYFDHAGGWHQFEQRAAHALEAERLTHPTTHNMVIDKYFSESSLRALPHANFSTEHYCVPGAAPTELLADGSLLDLGNRRFEVLHTPGVTDGSIVLYEQETGLLFGGETLADGDEFYTGEPAEYTNDADAEAHFESMQRLYELEVSTVHPGHGASFDGTRLRQILRGYFGT